MRRPIVKPTLHNQQIRNSMLGKRPAIYEDDTDELVAPPKRQINSRQSLSNHSMLQMKA